ncbi:MAG: C58 family peptidase [Planctomycetaceae bacterium]|nr:C58 family peptidase [Planctomycetaceae bacterium]
MTTSASAASHRLIKCKQTDFIEHVGDGKCDGIVQVFCVFALDFGAELGLKEVLASAHNDEESWIISGYIDMVMEAQDDTVDALKRGLRDGPPEDWADVTKPLGAWNERYAVNFRRLAYQDPRFGYGLEEQFSIPKAKIFVRRQTIDPFDRILEKTKKHLAKHYIGRAAAMLGVEALDGAAHAMALIMDGQKFYYFDPNYGLFLYNSALKLPLPLESSPQPFYYAHFVTKKDAVLRALINRPIRPESKVLS